MLPIISVYFSCKSCKKYDVTKMLFFFIVLFLPRITPLQAEIFTDKRFVKLVTLAKNTDVGGKIVFYGSI